MDMGLSRIFLIPVLFDAETNKEDWFFAFCAEVGTVYESEQFLPYSIQKEHFFV